MSGSVGFYEENAEDFFRRNVDVDMAPGWQAFTALLRPGGRVAEVGGLTLISMDVGGDSRPGRADERWLSVLCRRD